MIKCIVCGKKLDKNSGEICKSCYEVLKSKYPDPKNFERRLKCHKKQSKKLERR